MPQADADALLASVDQHKDDMRGSLQALADVVQQLQAGLNADSSCVEDAQAAVRLIDGAVAALTNMRKIVAPPADDKPPSHRDPTPASEQSTTNLGSLLKGLLPQLSVPSLPRLKSGIGSPTKMSPRRQPIGRADDETRPRVMSTPARATPIPIQTASSVCPASPRTSTWKHFVEDSCFMFPKGSSFCRGTKLNPALNTVPGILKHVRDTESEEEYGMGRLMLDFGQRIKAFGKEYTVGDECRKFQDALAQHLFLLWRYCVDTEEERAELRAGIDDVVTDLVQCCMLALFREYFRADDDEFSAAVDRAFAGRENRKRRPRENALTSKGVMALRAVAEGSDPTEKLDSILKCLTIIHSHLSNRTADDEKLKGADDILPLFMKCILMANPPHAKSTAEFIATFAPPSLMSGEAGYASATFSAALEYIRNASTDELVKHLVM